MFLELVSFLLLLLLLGLAGALVFNFILLIANPGYLHAVRTFWICVSSSSNWSFVEHIFLALWNNVLITLYLADMAWWLSHWRYWFVWVGFLYTLVNRLLSFCGMTRVSKNGMAPSALVFSAVNWIFPSIELMCWKKLFFVSFF